MNLNDLVDDYLSLGYEIADAQSKVCQDLILYKIGKSKYANNITIKGGVVMHNISKSTRRATRDLDLDFIKYSLDDNSIINFINELNKNDKESIVQINGNIEKLHHQLYDGKRVNVSIIDNYDNSLETKLDIGVHKYFELKQEEYIFDFDILDGSVSLLINSPEQIVCEKLKSLLKFGIRSTRYKDIFDFYYLINNDFLNRDRLLKYIDLLIIKDENMNQNSINEIILRLRTILNNRGFIAKLDNARSNWINIPLNDAIAKATSLISLAMGGYVYKTNSELFIMDTDNLNTLLQWDFIITTDTEFLSDGYRVQFTQIINNGIKLDEILDLVVETANIGNG